MSEWFFMKKCIYEILDFFFFIYAFMNAWEKMHVWNFGLFVFENAFMNVWFFLECIYNVCLNDFLWKNAFMKFWTFSFWKCIYECMNFSKCIYNICMNDFFYEKIHLWRRDFFNAYIMHERIFFWKNVFMNAWFFLDLFGSFLNMDAWIIFFENAYINEIFENAYMMYKIPEKCIRDFVNAYIDIYKLILFLWKYRQENLFFCFLSNFPFFIIITHGCSKL